MAIAPHPFERARVRFRRGSWTPQECTSVTVLSGVAPRRGTYPASDRFGFRELPQLAVPHRPLASPEVWISRSRMVISRSAGTVRIRPMFVPAAILLGARYPPTLR